MQPNENKSVPEQSPKGHGSVARKPWPVKLRLLVAGVAFALVGIAIMVLAMSGNGSQAGSPEETKPAVSGDPQRPVRGILQTTLGAIPMDGLQVEDEALGAEYGFDPSIDETPRVYKLPVVLSAEQTQQVIVDVRNLEKLVDLRSTLRSDNDELVELFQRSKDILYERVESGKGFKKPETSLRWAEVTGVSRGKLTVNLGGRIDFDEFGYLYRERIKAIKDRILAGKILAGDLRYIAVKQSQVIKILKDNEAALRATAELRDWFLEDDLFPAIKYPPDAEKFRGRILNKEIDKWKTMQDAIDAILQNRVGEAAAPPAVPR